MDLEKELTKCKAQTKKVCAHPFHPVCIGDCAAHSRFVVQLAKISVKQLVQAMPLQKGIR